MSRIEATCLRPIRLEASGRPEVARDGRWLTETLAYAVKPRAKSKFKTVLDVGELFTSDGRCRSHVVTRVTADADDDACPLRVEITHHLKAGTAVETLECVPVEGGDELRAGLFSRHLETADSHAFRHETADFGRGVATLPTATYPEVMLPFLMRGGAFDRRKRALYAWTSDRFIARVYYEVRGPRTLQVPAGSFVCDEVWMYPDLNDWIALGGLLTRLAKPLLPRYTMWFEAEPPRRLVRFEGAFGPPGAPEVTIELS